MSTTTQHPRPARPTAPPAAIMGAPGRSLHSVMGRPAGGPV